MSMERPGPLRWVGQRLDSLATRIPQFESRWLGAFKTIASRLTFYRGLLSFLMLIPAAYNLSPLIQSIFPSVWLFTGFLFAVLGVAAVLEYAVIFPSQILFNKSQASKNDRDPIYERARRADERTQEILKRMDDIETRLEDHDD